MGIGHKTRNSGVDPSSRATEVANTNSSAGATSLCMDGTANAESSVQHCAFGDDDASRPALRRANRTSSSGGMVRSVLSGTDPAGIGAVNEGNTHCSGGLELAEDADEVETLYQPQRGSCAGECGDCPDAPIRRRDGDVTHVAGGGIDQLQDGGGPSARLPSFIGGLLEWPLQIGRFGPAGARPILRPMRSTDDLGSRRAPSRPPSSASRRVRSSMWPRRFNSASNSNGATGGNGSVGGRPSFDMNSRELTRLIKEKRHLIFPPEHFGDLVDRLEEELESAGKQQFGDGRESSGASPMLDAFDESKAQCIDMSTEGQLASTSKHSSREPCVGSGRKEQKEGIDCSVAIRPASPWPANGTNTKSDAISQLELQISVGVDGAICAETFAAALAARRRLQNIFPPQRSPDEEVTAVETRPQERDASRPSFTPASPSNASKVALVAKDCDGVDAVGVERRRRRSSVTTRVSFEVGVNLTADGDSNGACYSSLACEREVQRCSRASASSNVAEERCLSREARTPTRAPVGALERPADLEAQACRGLDPSVPSRWRLVPGGWSLLLRRLGAGDTSREQSRRTVSGTASNPAENDLDTPTKRATTTNIGEGMTCMSGSNKPITFHQIVQA